MNLDKTPPQVALSAAPTVNEGSDLAITAAVSGGSDPSTCATIQAACWTWRVASNNGGVLNPSPDRLSAMYRRGAAATVTVALDVRDGHGNMTTATKTFEVLNVAPTVNPLPDLTIDEGGSISPSGTFYDPGGRNSFMATVDYGDGTGVQQLPPYPAPQPPDPPVTTHAFTLNHRYSRWALFFTVTVRITDSSGAVGTGTFKVTIRDKTPPTVSCGVMPNALWPANHRLMPVNATVTVKDTDTGSGPAGFTLDSVTSNEPDNGLGDGDTADDIQGFALGTSDTSGQLRAERSGTGSGRVYALKYTGKDVAGNSASCTTTVVVPHDQKK